MSNNRHQGNKLNELFSILIGVFISVLFYISLMIGCSVLILKGTINSNLLYALTHAIRALGIFAGVYAACLLTSGRKVFVSICCVGISIVLSVGCAVLLFNVNGMLVLWGVITSLLAGTGAVIINIRCTDIRVHQKVKRRYR